MDGWAIMEVLRGPWGAPSVSLVVIRPHSIPYFAIGLRHTSVQRHSFRFCDNFYRGPHVKLEVLSPASNAVRKMTVSLQKCFSKGVVMRTERTLFSQVVFVSSGVSLSKWSRADVYIRKLVVIRLCLMVILGVRPSCDL